MIPALTGRIIDEGVVARDPVAYRAYIQGSMGEFMVAKNMYVRAHSGWFSDRSVCYLASGRPVLAQDTGLAGVLPTREGLLTFSTPREAGEEARRLCESPAAHAAAARDLAERHFDSDRVLGRLLERIGVCG